MPRSPRLVEPGGIYHVSPRGNDGRAIFLGNADRERMLARLTVIARRHDWVVYGHCLMTNHLHLLVQVSEGGLSCGMQELLGGYSRWWNRRYDRTGHLFRNRFTSRPVVTERHLIATARYIDLNPVRANICSRPDQWRFSSYRAHVGLCHPEPFLAQSEFLKLVGTTPAKAQAAYRRFVREGHVPVSDTGGPGSPH